ncbi:MAG: hypothetical protein IJT24_05045 [Lachnospiraceae bacterium]|nr:hypothetical protein [Lachnospiraceae bacterium]
MKRRKRVKNSIVAVLISLSMLIPCMAVYGAEPEEWNTEVSPEEDVKEADAAEAESGSTEIQSTDGIEESGTSREEALTDNEEADPWTEYLEALSEAGKAALRIRLDDVPVKGYDLYLESGSLSAKSIAELEASGDLTKMERSESYDGVWILDKDMIDPDTRYYKSGYFLLYHEGTTQAYENNAFTHVASIWYSDMYFGSDNLADVDLYTVSFEPGEHEVLRLPDSFIHKKSLWYNSEAENLSYNGPAYLDSSYVESPGYLLAYWADENGKDTRNNYTIDHPVTLHPVFVNEQEAKYHHSDFSSYASENMYWEWAYDAETEDNNAVPVVASTAEELMKALKDKKKTFVIVRGDVKLKAEEVKKICDDNGLSYNSWSGGEGPLTFGAYNYSEGGDFLIIEDGASLTLDQVEIHSAVNWETKGLFITVQNDGKLVMKNNGGLEYAQLSVQEGGLVEMEKSGYRLDCDYLYNHGTIRFDSWEEYDPAKDMAYLPRMEVHNSFFNFNTGVLEAQYGTFEFELDDNSWLYNDEHSDIGDMSIVRMRNGGEMRFEKNCRVTIGGDSSVYQQDRYAQMPFVNNGSFTFSDSSSKNTLYYQRSALEIEYGSLVNNGTFSITNEGGKAETSESGTSLYLSGSGLAVYEARLINNGRVLLDNASGVGIRVSGLFYDPSNSGGLSRTSVDTPQRGCILNNEGGMIEVRNGKNSVGMAFGIRTEFTNKGEVNLQYRTGGGTEGSMALALQQGTYANEDASAVVNNEGLVQNDSYIAYGDETRYIWNGNKWSGSGKEGLFLAVGGSTGEDPDKPDPELVVEPIPGGGGATDPQPELGEEVSSLTLVKGQKFYVSAKDWKLSNSSPAKVLAVTKTTVTAKKPGTATLSRPGQSIDVTVVAPAITKAEKTVKLVAGGEKQLSFSGATAEKGAISFSGAPEALPVSFSSSAPDVARVDEDGNVQAITRGSAVVSAYINGVLFKITVKVADADTSKRDFTKEVSLVPMQSVNVKLGGFTPKKAVWTSDRTALSSNELKRGVAFEDEVVRITTAGKITAVGGGTTHLIAAGGSADPVEITVTVGEPVEKTVHLNKNASRKLAMYGTKGTLKWEPDTSGIVKIDKNSVKGIEAGAATLSASYEGFTYKVKVYVEDPSIAGSSKPYAKTLTLKAGETDSISLTKVYQTVLFKSDRSQIAYVDSDNVIHARTKGTAKLTARVNGKNLTITVKVTK